MDLTSETNVQVSDKNTPDNSPHPKRACVETSNPAVSQPNWKLGQPYFRTDGPGYVQQGQIVADNNQMQAFVNTQIVTQEQPMIGHDNASSSVVAQPPMSLRDSAQMFSTWRTSYVSPQNSPYGSPGQGHMAPMADVASSSWATGPVQGMVFQAGLQAQARQQWGGRPKSSPTAPGTKSGVVSASASGHATPRKKTRNRNRGQQI